ncbi:PEP-CTERM sorting domain-containing protein [Haloferula sp.]|uniref:PEP-CTERM sorting domain-containing protein n=1 Tax=Haloferula sp. TaxID=2497595 RepID=UPI00329E7CA8
MPSLTIPPSLLVALPAILALASPASLNAAVVSATAFNFVTAQAAAINTADLESIEISGITYSDLIVPDAYTNIDLTGAAELRLNTAGQGVTPASGTWETQALDAFASRNLNHYQQLDAGNFNATWRLSYGSGGIAADASLFLVVTERNGNNPFIIEAFDADDNSLGVLSVPVTDYTPTGATSLSTSRLETESINAVIYELSDLVAPGSANLAYIEITNNFNIIDGGDGKVFFFGDASTVPEPSSGLLGMVGALGLLRRKRRA